MKISELQKELKIWLENRGVNDETINKWVQLSILVEEVGETSSTITKGSGDTSEEIADVIISATCLAISLDIDINDAIEKKLKKLQERTPHIVDEHIRITHD